MNTKTHISDTKSLNTEACRSMLAAFRLAASILLFAVIVTAQTKDFAKWVNPFIGTGGHGHTFPGATMPFGMVQLSPDTRIDNWDGSSGYHYSDDIIYGFSHTHLSGTGIPDGADILFMPTVGLPFIFGKEGDRSENGYASKFSHQNERAEPGYYSVRLDDDNILAEMTATTRVGLHRYTFPKTDKANITLDLIWRDKTLDSELKVDSIGRRIEGYRVSSSWAKNQKIYFVAEFSEPFSGILSASHSHSNEDIRNKKSVLVFNATNGRPVLIKVAISHVSIEGARKNLAAELPGWDFDKVRADAKAAWNKELSKIEVSGGTDAQTTNFYSALYHTMIQPNVFNDVDGRYRGHDGKIHQVSGYSSTPLAERRSSASPGVVSHSRGYAARFQEERHSREDENRSSRKSTAFPLGEGKLSDEPIPNPKSKIQNPKSEQYTVFSLWDTFRAAHPLYTIIDQKRTVDFINTFIRQYEQGGRLPVWELWGEETDTMIGYHAVSVIADAMAKGIKGFDYEKAYTAAKHSANLDHHGLAGYKSKGFISTEDDNEGVSKTLEYAYNDYCIATMAQSLMRENLKDMSPAGRQRHDRLEKEAAEYFTRSQYYRNLFDPKTGFMRPRRNGGFVEPFAPNEVTFHFTEGNSWVYSFFVPHDVAGLAELHGGKINLAKKIDELFTTDQKLTGRFQPDITGLIGQYAHGNEPSHHIAYLYNYVNQPWKTQSYVRRILNDFYKPTPDGLIGNEDCGQMSAWYILSSLGFYQVNPSRAVYDIGAPLFPEAKIRLENGKVFTIKAPNAGANAYVRSLKLDGKPHRSTWFQHRDLTKGGTLEFEMAKEPVKDWFTEFSFSEVGGGLVAVPVIDAGGRTFQGTATVSIHSLADGAKLLYSTDGSEPKLEYTKPFTVDKTTTVKAIAIDDRKRTSKIAEAIVLKRPNDWTVKLTNPYSTQYTGGGEDGIIDGIRGTVNFGSGEWQGYQGKPFEAFIDLNRETKVSEVGGSFLQSAGSWIWMPDRIEVETSMDGTNFTKVADWKPGFPQQEMKGSVKEFVQKIAPVTARFVRMRAYNFGKIPAWHLGAGGDPWIFVDEVIVR